MSKLSNSNQDRAKELYPAVSGSYTRLQSLSDYDALYKQSTTEPKKFYSDAATNFLVWDTPFDPENPFEFDMLTGSAKWFEGGELNACYNCVDKHLDDRGDQVALIWESDDGSDIRKVTFAELHQHVCKFANTLEACEIKKGDRVCIYMPMVLEAVYAMLACARIGAIHSVVFGGFSPDSIRNRILDAGCSAVITADGGRRGGLEVPLKSNIDQALTEVDCVHTVLVVEHTGTSVPMQEGRDKWYGEVAEGLVDPFTHTATPMRSEDPLFILYTSGSTGKPKGVVHSTAGYLLGATMTFHYLFDYREDEVFWCTADVGWITGHTYIVYGPLANGATTLIYEGVPTYPDASRCWDMVERHQVSIFYTAPTAIRALMAQGDAFITKHSRKSLRLLGSVGEPINPEAWRWYYEVVGESRCPIIDSWWQTETGAAMITPLGSLFDLKPGSATRPFFGVEPVLLTPEGREVTTTDANGDMQGLLAIKNSWPGQIRTVYGDHQRMIDTYFKEYPGYYLTGDAARRDKDGYWWITGRVDDVLNVSGHRLGTAEVESALVAHPKVAEAAVVGRGHPIKGEGIYAFVTLVAGVEFTPALVKEMRQTVSDVLSPIAKPDWIQWAPSLPKTRSGKIMRRILRKISVNEIDDLGDTTTLADPAVLDDLIKLRED